MTWRTLGLLISFFLTAFKSVTPASAFDVYKGRSSNGGTCMINDSSGSGKDNLNLIAGIVEHDARSDRMIICPVWICIPQARVMMQIRQPTNDLDEVDVAKDEDSRKVKSAFADVISQIPKPRFVACSILGKVIAVVSQTAKASMGLKKYNVAMHEGCPICVGKASEQIRYFDEPRQCSNCSSDKTDDSSLFSERAKYGASMFHVRAV